MFFKTNGQHRTQSSVNLLSICLEEHLGNCCLQLMAQQKPFLLQLANMRTGTWGFYFALLLMILAVVQPNTLPPAWYMWCDQTLRIVREYQSMSSKHLFYLGSESYEVTSLAGLIRGLLNDVNIIKGHRANTPFDYRNESHSIRPARQKRSVTSRP